MKRVADIAMKECERELRAACRLPIDQAAVDVLVGWLRPNFERILGHPEGGRRWADHGHRMRDNARYMGTFADFFASHAETGRVGVEELSRAFQLVRADCTVRAERTPLAWEYCREDEPEVTHEDRRMPDARDAEEFLRTIAPTPEVV
jgi:hypothetical protein